MRVVALGPGYFGPLETGTARAGVQVLSPRTARAPCNAPCLLLCQCQSISLRNFGSPLHARAHEAAWMGSAG
eukprot:376643-Prymnesium_polylepis.1